MPLLDAAWIRLLPRKRDTPDKDSVTFHVIFQAARTWLGHPAQVCGMGILPMFS